MSDLSQASSAVLETTAKATMRAWMRQSGGPDMQSMCRVLDNIADEFRVLVGAFSDDWQNTLANRLKESSDELAGELAEAPEIFGGTFAQLDALTVRRVGQERDEQRARHIASAPF